MGVRLWGVMCATKREREGRTEGGTVGGSEGARERGRDGKGRERAEREGGREGGGWEEREGRRDRGRKKGREPQGGRGGGEGGRDGGRMRRMDRGRPRFGMPETSSAARRYVLARARARECPCPGRAQQTLVGGSSPRQVPRLLKSATSGLCGHGDTPWYSGCGCGCGCGSEAVRRPGRSGSARAEPVTAGPHAFAEDGEPVRLRRGAGSAAVTPSGLARAVPFVGTPATSRNKWRPAVPRNDKADCQQSYQPCLAMTTTPCSAAFPPRSPSPTPTGVAWSLGHCKLSLLDTSNCQRQQGAGKGSSN